MTRALQRTVVVVCYSSNGPCGVKATIRAKAFDWSVLLGSSSLCDLLTLFF